MRTSYYFCQFDENEYVVAAKSLRRNTCRTSDSVVWSEGCRGVRARVEPQLFTLVGARRQRPMLNLELDVSCVQRGGGCSPHEWDAPVTEALKTASTAEYLFRERERTNRTEEWDLNCKCTVPTHNYVRVCS